jgi:hypothetical protein
MAGMLDNVGAVSTEDPTTISQEAQDVAKATGVSHTDIATSQTDRDPVDFQNYDATGTSQELKDETTFKEADTYVDQAKSTVAGQLSTILADDSPYIQLNERMAQEKAAGRGLTNSSIAARQGQLAAIQSALPIAQQDAETYARAQGAQQQAEYGQETIKSEAIVSGGLVEQKALIERKNTDINNAFTAMMSGADAQQKIWGQDLQNTFNKGLQQLEQAHQQQMLTLELNENQAAAVAEHAAGIMQNYQVSVENLLSDPDFLEMGATAVNNAVNQLQTLAANSIGFIGASQDVNMDVWLEDYLDNLTVL